jgi:hypothetical protein
MCQSYVAFDTSSIPDSNTISSATIKATGASTAFGTGLGSIAFGDPANATLQFRYHDTSLPTNTRGNNNSTPYLTKAGFAAKTLAATFAAASTWSTSTENTLTSDAALPGLINKTGTTAFVVSTDEYATGNAQSGAQAYAMRDAPTYTTLTVVHSFIGSATVAASLTATPAIATALSFARSIAASLTVTPGIAETIAYLQTIAADLSVSPAVTTITAYLRSITASITTSPVVTRSVSIAQTIAATLSGTASVATEYLPVVVGIPRQLVLKVRDRVSLSGTGRIRITVRNILRLPEE